MWKSTSQLICAAAIAGVAVTATTALAQTAANYPSKPITVIIPYDPGGGPDTVVRIVGEETVKGLGQRFVIDNRPGGDTVIGTQAMTRAAPDGYTLLAVTGTHVINPWLRKLPYDAIKDFASVATLIRTEHMLVVNPSFPANTLKEFLAYAKSNGDKINAAATGGQNQVDTLMFMSNIGAKFTVVPYKSAPTQINDLIAGTVQMSLKPLLFSNQVKAGKIRALVVWRDGGRSALLPDVPTAPEAGLNFTVANGYVVHAPAATPRDIVQKLNNEFRRALAAPAVVAGIEKAGYSVFSTTVAEAEAWTREAWPRLIFLQYIRFIWLPNFPVEISLAPMLGQIFLLTAPLFLLVLLGYGLIRWASWPAELAEALTRFVFSVAIPALLFRLMSGVSRLPPPDWRLLIVFFGSCLLVFVLGRVVGRLIFRMDGVAQSVFGLGGIFSNIILLGLPMTRLTLGDEAIPVVSLIIVFNALTLWTLVTISVEWAKNRSTSLEGLGRTLRDVLTNPLVAGILSGTAFSFTGIELPQVIDRTLGLVAEASAPLALVALGMGLATYQLAAGWKESLALCAIKLAVQPLMVYFLARAIGLSTVETQAVVLVAACPIGVNVYLMARQFKTLEAAVASSMVLSTLLSSLSIPVTLALLKA